MAIAFICWRHSCFCSALVPECCFRNQHDGFLLLESVLNQWSFVKPLHICRNPVGRQEHDKIEKSRKIVIGQSPSSYDFSSWHEKKIVVTPMLTSYVRRTIVMRKSHAYKIWRAKHDGKIIRFFYDIARSLCDWREIVVLSPIFARRSCDDRTQPIPAATPPPPPPPPPPIRYIYDYMYSWSVLTLFPYCLDCLSYWLMHIVLLTYERSTMICVFVIGDLPSQGIADTSSMVKIPRDSWSNSLPLSLAMANN